MTNNNTNFSYFCFSKATDKVIAKNENRVVETASTIKLLIVAKLFYEVQAGNISLRKPVKVLREDVGQNGSGVLQYFYLHKSIELYNLAVLMMTVSDNVATNVLIRLLGHDDINKFAGDIGLKQTKLIVPKFNFQVDYDVCKTPTGHSTPKEMAQLVDKLLTGNLFGKGLQNKVWSLMQAVQGSNVVRQLPYTFKGDGTQNFGSKTGWIYDWSQNLRLAECGFIIDSNKNMQIFSLFLDATFDKELPYSMDSNNRQSFSKLARDIYDELSS